MSSVQLGGESAKQKRLRLLPFVIGGLILVFAPIGMPAYYKDMLSYILIYAIFVMSFDLMLGYLGLISFGHQAYWGTGAYTVAILASKGITADFWLTLLICIAVSFILAAILGLLVMRTTGIYFTLVNLAFAMALFSLSIKWTSLTGGFDGICGFARPWDLTGMGFYYFVFAFFAICFLLMRWITSARYGRILIGIRDNESRMRALGYNTWAFKYCTYVIAGVFGGIAGFLAAYHGRIVSPDSYGFFVTGTALLMVLVGGKASQVGSLIGSIIIIVLFRVLSVYTEHWLLVVGIIFVLLVLFAREGVLGYVSQLWKKVKYEYESVGN